MIQYEHTEYQNKFFYALIIKVMIFFTNSFCTIFSNALKDEVSAKYEVYQIHRGFNIKSKSENQKRKTLKISKRHF